ncbi:hypothetical protein IFM89_001397 [Coptis chinensis]|uniref:Uncharacterized protein n=1 Tax=Coptis chinensis TaxID=261450 RepID=A0A835HTA6_9MAGN|nr:hypothetical protein IFM89_001397 [Coptis chinensis]
MEPCHTELLSEHLHSEPMENMIVGSESVDVESSSPPFHKRKFKYAIKIEKEKIGLEILPGKCTKFLTLEKMVFVKAPDPTGAEKIKPKKELKRAALKFLNQAENTELFEHPDSLYAEGRFEESLFDSRRPISSEDVAPNGEDKFRRAHNLRRNNGVIGLESADLVNVRKEKERKKKWDEKNQEAIAEAVKNLDQFDQKHKKVEDISLKGICADLQSRVDYVQKQANRGRRGRSPSKAYGQDNSGDPHREEIDNRDRTEVGKREPKSLSQRRAMNNEV